MQLPSKELLSEVLGRDVKFIEFDIETIKRRIHGSARDNDIYYHDGKWKFINIYELAHKCKEWAHNKGGVDIVSGKRLELDGWECLVFTGVMPYDCYTANTEPEAIFKACECILEIIKDKA